MNKRHKEQVLLTGSMGFIGSNFLKKIISQYEVIGVNNILDKKSSHYHPINQNISQLKVKEIPEDLHSIVHLAAITDTKYCEKYPQKCFDTNVKGTQNLLEIARKKDAKFVYVSTSHVYGAPKKLPINEDDPKKPLSIYAATKLAGEISCLGYTNSYGMDISIARLFSVYGPKSPQHLVTSRIMSQLKEKYIYLGNLNSERDFIFIEDVISALELILQKTHKYNDYNVGTGKPYSIQKISDIIKKISKNQTPIQSSNQLLRKNEVKKIICNPTKLKKLGWKPKVSIYSGLRQTWESYDRNQKT